MNYYCAKFNTNILIQQIWMLQIFSNFSPFLHRIFTIFPEKSNFGPVQLGITAYIVSKAMNYNYAKFHAFIKKLPIDVIFRLTYFMCCKLTLPHVLSV